MIKGMHAMFYSSHATELRAFFRDKLGLPATDVGDGWLIFDAPEADLGVHPTGERNGPNADNDAANSDRNGGGGNSGEGSIPSGTADISFYCDDIADTVRELRTRGVEFTQDVEDHGYGLVTFFKVPGGFKIQLYQPKYAK